MANRGDNVCAIYVDMGTTNTRVWLVNGSHIVTQADRPLGARDTARDGSPARLIGGLAELIAFVRAQAQGQKPLLVAAAGMIGSALRLAPSATIPPPPPPPQLPSLPP